MFIPLEITGTQALADEFLMTKDEVDSMVDFVVKEVTAGFATEWANQAKTDLSKSRSQYMRSIKVVDKGKFEGEVRLVGKLPNMIESGMNPFDLKAGFEKSDKRIAKDDGGWYLTIPMRYAAADSLGESDIFAGKMPDEISQLAKGLNVGESLQESDLPEQNQKERTIRREIKIESAVFKEYVAKTAQFTGLTKTGEEGHTGYVTFRRVSDKTDDNAWIHSGIQAHNLAEKALESMDIPVEVGNIINQYIDSIR